MIQISLGVARDLAHEPPALRYRLDEPVRIAGELQDYLYIRHFSYDPTMAPAGKSVLTVSIESDYAYWRPLSEEPGLYEAEKARIAQCVIASLDKRFPGLAAQIDVIDVSTPLTIERYTGNWMGAYEGWLITTQDGGWGVGQSMKKTLSGLKNFYMVGQWVEPGGGLPTVALSGRNAVQLICHNDHKEFVTTMPEAALSALPTKISEEVYA
jgi:phytoene dehydrogenase-like protein